MLKFKSTEGWNKALQFRTSSHLTTKVHKTFKASKFRRVHDNNFYMTNTTIWSFSQQVSPIPPSQKWSIICWTKSGINRKQAEAAASGYTLSISPTFLRSESAQTLKPRMLLSIFCIFFFFLPFDLSPSSCTTGFWTAAAAAGFALGIWRFTSAPADGWKRADWGAGSQGFSYRITSTALLFI